MFRDRPLTWLFVIATVVVDYVLIVAQSDSDPPVFRVGFVIGQLGAMAIWTVRGKSHRLTRVSCLVGATGTLPFTILEIDDFSFLLTFLTGYVAFTVVVTIAGDYMRTRFTRNSDGGDHEGRWRFPLIEFFGWTTLVAIISFGARHMDLRLFTQRNIIMLFIAMLATPVSATVLIRHDLRDLRSVKAILLLLVAVVAAVYMGQEIESGEYIVFSQTAYLALWLAVLGMDEVRRNAKNVHESLPEENPQATTSKPKLFNPQD